jgi:hypothetical protein
VLVVMARQLMRGSVKTRLAGTIGDDAALTLYGRLLAGTLEQAERLEGVTLVMAQADQGPSRGPRRRHAADPLVGRASRWQRLSQRGETLGERLAAVFADVFDAGARAVAVIDSDSPAIPLDYLEQAFAQMGDRRLVVGPAADGGYYLVGLDHSMWRRHSEAVVGLLTSSPMSTASLLAYTERAARVRGLDLVQLPLWVDVDDPDDVALLERLEGGAPLRGEPLESLREVYLHVTHRCGRACRHCYNTDSLWDPDELTTDQWRDAIDQCVALGASSFVFIGGDPLLRDDFVPLVDHITGTHEAKARFFFNSYVDEALAGELARVGRGLLRPLVSIDGPRDINDELRGEGSYDDVMASIANLLAVGLEPVANTVLVRPALPGLAQLARELRAAGLSRLHLILPHQAGGVAAAATRADQGCAPAGGARGTDARLGGGLDLVPSGDELLAAVRELLCAAADIGLTVDNLPSWRRRLGARNDLCAAGCKDLSVDPYGNVHACVITAGDPAFVAGSLRAQPLGDIWRASSSLRLLRAARARDRAECLVCPVVDACGGECWVQAHYAARAHERPAGYTAPFPYCDLVRPMLEELAAEAERAVATAQAAAPAAVACGAACEAGGGQSSAGEADYSLFDCI